MKDILKNIKNVRKWSEHTMNIPIHYLLFLIALFLVWQPQYIEMIDASSWLPAKIQMIILSLINGLYAYSIKIIIVFVILVIIISVLNEYTAFFKKTLPKPIQYNDRTTITWNPYSAMNRLIRMITSLLTTWWIYYFLINVILNESDFARHFFNLNDPFQNELLLNLYLTEGLLHWMHGLFWLNIFILLYFIMRALFQIKVPEPIFYINANEIERERRGKYIILNKYVKKGEVSTTEILIVKELYNKKPKYYLISNELRHFRDIRVNDQEYKVLNHSEDLDEVIYHFEFLKS